MFPFIQKKSFLVNLLVIILLVVILIFIFFGILGWITHHDQTQKVPSVVGMSYDQATKSLEAAGFEVEMQDSIFNETAKPLQVLRQSPETDDIVKSGRTIYLTINRSVPPQVEMPDLRGYSIKSAELYLQSLGLKEGDVSYVYDIAKNAVKDQKYNGNPIAPGTKVNVGTVIDLIVGNGVSENVMDVPDLTGMQVSEAKGVLSSDGVELGAIIALDAISDTSAAYVVNQKPAPYSTDASGNTVRNQIHEGQIVDIWVSRQRLIKDSAHTNQ